jgi:carbon monoxide dehydrogenase subunit G
MKELDAPAQVVWDVLNDPEQMAKLLPGVESFEVADDRHWSASVKVPLGMGALALRFAFEKLEERPIEYSKLSAKGQGVGAIVSMETDFHLTPNGDRTSMRWEADVRVAGPIGSMGQRVFQPIVNQQVGNVLTALEKVVSEAKAGE